MQSHSLEGLESARLARELTKVHEEFARGRLSELAEACGASPPKGECTVVIEGVTRGAHAGL